ncbi:MAG: hypothetical protein RQM92_17380 [Candidatus Syntrophopropionicum ammoniitolerans]
MAVSARASLSVFLSVLILLVCGCTMVGHIKQTSVEVKVAVADELEQTVSLETIAQGNEENGNRENPNTVEVINENEHDENGKVPLMSRWAWR